MTTMVVYFLSFTLGNGEGNTLDVIFVLEDMYVHVVCTLWVPSKYKRVFPTV